MRAARTRDRLLGQTTGLIRLLAEYGRPCVLPPRLWGAGAHRWEIRVKEVDEILPVDRDRALAVRPPRAN